MPVPKYRRLQLALYLNADSLDELCSALQNIATDLMVEGKEERHITSGGYSSGYQLNLTVPDPEMTGEKYREWLENRK